MIFGGLLGESTVLWGVKAFSLTFVCKTVFEAVPGAARPRLHWGGGSETDLPDTGDRRYLSTGAFAARELWPST